MFRAWPLSCKLNGIGPKSGAREALGIRISASLRMPTGCC